MQIILQKSVQGLGMVGDVIDVKNGYYRNYLAPRNLALLANHGRIKQWEHHKRVVEVKKGQEKGKALELKTILEGRIFKVEHAAAGNDKLFGSITSQEIVRILREAGFVVDRKFVLLETPIKTLGEHEVGVKLHPEVTAQVKFEVARHEKEPKKEEPKVEKKKTKKAVADTQGE